MKSIFFIFSTILIQFTFAQNYQTFNSGRTVFFEDESKSVAALSIDLVTADTDSILFPFKIFLPVGGFCFSPYYSSWIGHEIIIKPNSENLFFNKYYEKITIKTNAMMNEAWTFYQSDEIIVIAEITEWDTEVFLGVEDSVKTISLQAFDINMDAIEHSINDTHLRLSKNYGLLSVLNFYLFPETDYQYSLEFLPGFYLTTIGMTNPDLGFQNLTMYRVFDFQPGDELHILEYKEENQGKLFERKTILHYLERTDFNDSIIYKVDRLSYYQDFQSDSAHYTRDTIFNTIKPDDNFDRLPGEIVMNDFYSEFWSIKNNDMIRKENCCDNFSINYMSIECWEFSHIDCGYYNGYYLEGLGGKYFYQETGNMVFSNIHSKSLVYHKKGEETWGVPLTISSIVNEPVSNKFTVYPNPAKNHVNIHAETSQTLMVEIFELTGKLVMTGKIRTDEDFNIGSLSKGIYLIKITDKKRNSFINKIVKE